MTRDGLVSALKGLGVSMASRHREAARFGSWGGGEEVMTCYDLTMFPQLPPFLY